MSAAAATDAAAALDAAALRWLAWLQPRPAAARAPWLQRLARRRPALHQRLQRLLKAAHQAADATPGLATAELAALCRPRPAADAGPADDTAGKGQRGDPGVPDDRGDSGDTAGWPAPAVGDRVGPYRLVHRLGQGGMASVWLARPDGAPGAPAVALKLPRHRRGAQHLARERALLVHAAHPQVVALAGVQAPDDGAATAPPVLPWLALAPVAGQTLDTWCLGAGARSTPAQRLRLADQLLQVLAHLHTRGVVHGDLKPQNLMVTLDGRLLLLDLGVGRRLAPHELAPGPPDAQPSPPPSVLHGPPVLTPRYAAPEQLAGAHCSLASDVYAAALVLAGLGAMPAAMSAEQALVVARARHPDAAARWRDGLALLAAWRRAAADPQPPA